MSVKYSVAAALLAAAPFVAASGATVKNSCSFPMYVWQIDSPAFPSNPTAVLQPGQSWTDSYKTNPDGGGVSIKIAKTTGDLYTGDIQQFEYTLAGANVFYDISNINGNPLMSDGSSLIPSDTSASSCIPLYCPAGDIVCKLAYNLPDDVRTHSCGSSVALIANLCGGGSGSGSSSSSSSAAAPVVPAPSSDKVIAPAHSSTTIPVAAPSITKAPVGEPAANPNVVIMTTFVTAAVPAHGPMAVQIGANGGPAQENPIKRHLHEHQHAHHHQH